MITFTEDVSFPNIGIASVEDAPYSGNCAKFTDRRRSLSKAGSFQALPLVLILIGCPRIDFETETVVSEDGSVVRTTRFVASDESDEAAVEKNSARRELEDKHTFLDGGVWDSRVERTTNDDGKVTEEIIDTYSVTAHYEAGARIPSDHVRRGEMEGRALRNTIVLTTSNYFFVKFFDFRELYRDDVGRELARAVIEKSYPDWVEHMAEYLANGLEGLSVAEARAVVRELSDPWVQKFLEGVYIPQLADPELDNDAAVNAFLVRLPPPSDAHTQAWREIIDEAFDESFDLFWERDDVEEAFFGVNDIDLWWSDSFEQSLTMPGEIISTNADSVSGSVLVWEFESEVFLLQDHALEARSRVVYPARIVGAGVLFVALSLTIWSRRTGRAG